MGFIEHQLLLQLQRLLAMLLLLLQQLLAFLAYRRHLQLLPFPASFALLVPLLMGSSFIASSRGC
jgi:hypothetical protein